MRVPFRKMHGLGNDFVVIDGREAPVAMSARRAAALAHRQTGIGCDQLVLLEPSDRADVKMRIFNPDGSEVAACGNATRAVGLLLGGDRSIETLAGLLSSKTSDKGIAVDMGRPRFGWNEIPVAYALDTLEMPVGWEDLEGPSGVNVGNPHAVFFVPDCDAVELERLGPIIENDPLFPERINVNVATVESRNRIRLRVWERGAGLTLACGTGACATAVAAMRRKLVDRTVTVALPGGELTIAWPEDGAITMTGPAQFAFEGSFESADFPL